MSPTLTNILADQMMSLSAQDPQDLFRVRTLGASRSEVLEALTSHPDRVKACISTWSTIPTTPTPPRTRPSETAFGASTESLFDSMVKGVSESLDPVEEEPSSTAINALDDILVVVDGKAILREWKAPMPFNNAYSMHIRLSYNGSSKASATLSGLVESDPIITNVFNIINRGLSSTRSKQVKTTVGWKSIMAMRNARRADKTAKTKATKRADHAWSDFEDSGPSRKRILEE